MHSADCILVFGVSGVGKTFACEDFVSRHADFEYYRASRLLADALSANSEALRTADAADIQTNQGILSREFRRRRGESPTKSALVDVHAVIDNDRGLVRVPIETISAIGADALVLLEAPVVKIAARRLADARPRPARSHDALTREQGEERLTVAEYARLLDLPLEVVHYEDGTRLDETINKLQASLRNRRRKAD